MGYSRGLSLFFLTNIFIFYTSARVSADILSLPFGRDLLSFELPKSVRIAEDVHPDHPLSEVSQLQRSSDGSFVESDGGSRLFFLLSVGFWWAGSFRGTLGCCRSCVC